MKKAIIIGSLFLYACFLTTCSPSENVTFINELNLTPIGNNLFKLNTKMSVEIDKHLVTVPAGFQTDFASIPKIFWSLESPLDFKTIDPSILHDYMYTCPNNLSRSKIDSIYYSALIDNLVNPVKAYVYWVSVRLFGKSHFNKDNHCAIASKEYSQKVSP